MFCKQCGTQIEDGLTFCTSCGAKQTNDDATFVDKTVFIGAEEAQPVSNQYEQTNDGFNQTAYKQSDLQQDTYAYSNTDAGTNSSSGKVSFWEAIKLFFVKYADFNGRSNRSEYWWAFLFNFLVSAATSKIVIVGPIIALGLLIPGLAVGVRRLHDTGKSWTYILFGLIPIVGTIILIVQYCKASDGDNRWGPTPGK